MIFQLLNLCTVSMKKTKSTIRKPKFELDEKIEKLKKV